MEFNRNGIGTVWVQFFSSSYDGLDPGWGRGDLLRATETATNFHCVLPARPEE